MTKDILTDQDQLFYSRLPVRRIRLGDLLRSRSLYETLPQTWHIIVTDITGSTKVVDAGQHQDVNLIAAGSIVVVLNIASQYHIDIPFFFGGDGATFIVPPVIHSEAMRALDAYHESVKKNYEIDIRVGSVPVRTVYQAGQDLLISKYTGSGKLIIPVILGNGIQYAESLVKRSDPEPGTDDDTTADLTGVQCRWNRIAAPEGKEEVVTLLVSACKTGLQGEAFSKVVTIIDRIYGNAEKRQPISIGKLNFNSRFSGIIREMRFRVGKLSLPELITTWLKNLYGHIWFRTSAGKMYMKKLIERSDTLVLDGRINMIISGNSSQRSELETALDEIEASGQIKYGLHTGSASVMTCYVRDLENDHIHFVDGEKGGYTQAAKILKAKLRS